MAAWINEFHYDNAGTDVGEFIEVAGTAGLDLTGWSLVLYNGNGGAAYGTVNLSGTIANQSNGFGALSFAASGLQNGPPDGFALVDALGAVVQFLSYEGSFAAVGGAANGMVSTDIGIAQFGTEAVGSSLQLVGTGANYASFSWAPTNDDSPGALNDGQTIQVPRAWINEFHYDNAGADVGEFIEVAGTAGLDLTGWTLVLYNGNGGPLYATVNLSGTIANQSNGFGALSFAVNGIQNGPPDGFALVDALGAVVQFLSYEGSFTAVGGAANGMVSTDIGIAQFGTEPVGSSLQLVGTGDDYAEFTWAPTNDDSPGAVNGGQVFSSATTVQVSIDDVTVAEANSGTTNFVFTVTRSDTASAFTLDFATADGTATAGSDYAAATGTLTFTAGGAASQTVTVTVNGDTAFEPNETFFVNLSNLAATTGTVVLSDAQGQGTITNDDAPPLTLISAIQGSGDASPIAGQTVMVEAIVVGDFQNGDADARRNLQGFFLQEEDADTDANALTSEGLFVFQGTAIGDVAIGDRVRITGTVSEFFGQTQLTAASISVLSTGNALPTAAEILLPAASVTTNQNGALQPDLEAYEGMRVVFTQTLTITEQFQLDRFNEIKLVAGDRPAQFTQENAPGGGYATSLVEVGARTITYDDGLNTQNQPIDNLDGFGPAYATANAPRMGDTVTDLAGVLDYQWAGSSVSGATWRVRATEDGANTFEEGNPRPAAPPDVGGTLAVAAFNVLNFFTTINAGGAVTAIGDAPRGANSLAEFDRQAEKLLTALDLLGAEVIGLIELENDFQPGSSGNAIEFIVEGLNAIEGTDVWSWVNPDTQFVGGDAIAVGLIYRNDAVQLASGTTVGILETGLIATSGRAPIAASFEDLVSGEVFTVTVNHFKSKGSAATLPGDVDQGDGQGLSNATRVQQAQELRDWLATDPTGAGDSDVLIIGDLNSYAMEDPIQLLEDAGFVNLKQPGDYSYVFNGLTGSLDHALASASLAAKVAGAAAWHINADEADALDYNLDFGRDAAIFDGTVPFRSADHDPLLVGLAFPNPNQLLVLGNLADSVDGGAGADTINGRGGDDTLLGGEGDDVLSGGAGDDELDGGAGNDRMVGGVGNDLYRVDSASDRVVERADSGEDMVATTVSLRLRAHVENGQLEGTGDLVLSGNDLDNALSGNDGNNRLLGAEGNDSLAGGAGNDALIGGEGADTLEGGAGLDRLRGDAGADRFLFSAIPAFGEADRILDFTAEDEIAILATAFDPTLALGTLDPLRFVANLSGQATTPGLGMFVFESDAARLWFDTDGAAAGRTLVAILPGVASLAADDIVVV